MVQYTMDNAWDSQQQSEYRPLTREPKWTTRLWNSLSFLGKHLLKKSLGLAQDVLQLDEIQ